MCKIKIKGNYISENYRSRDRHRWMYIKYAHSARAAELEGRPQVVTSALKSLRLDAPSFDSVIVRSTSWLMEKQTCCLRVKPQWNCIIVRRRSVSVSDRTHNIISHGKPNGTNKIFTLWIIIIIIIFWIIIIT